MENLIDLRELKKQGTYPEHYLQIYNADAQLIENLERYGWAPLNSTNTFFWIDNDRVDRIVLKDTMAILNQTKQKIHYLLSRPLTLPSMAMSCGVIQ